MRFLLMGTLNFFLRVLRASSYTFLNRMGLAGRPTATAHAGISPSTEACAPIIDSFRTVAPDFNSALTPSQHPCSTTVAASRAASDSVRGSESD